MKKSLQFMRQIFTISELPETHKLLHKTCVDFANNVLIPNAAGYDKTHTFPANEVMLLLLCNFNFSNIYYSIYSINNIYKIQHLIHYFV